MARGESSTRVSQLAWQDATVVVQTGILNDLAREIPSDGEEMRFILISGDATLHAVYADQSLERSRRRSCALRVAPSPAVHPDHECARHSEWLALGEGVVRYAAGGARYRHRLRDPAQIRRLRVGL